MNSLEEWKDVPSYEGIYYISNFGRVKRWQHKPRDNKPRWKYIVDKKDKDGYCIYTFSHNNRKITYKIHRLVLSLFDPIDNSESYQVNHKDFNKSNNCLSNLEWVTASENCIHRTTNLGLRGEKASNARLKKHQIVEIKNLCKAGIKQSKIAENFGITQSYVSEINRGKKWKQ